jgi:hypothetical protein
MPPLSHAYGVPITDETETDEGLFTIQKVDDKYYFEIPESLYDTDMLLVTRMGRAQKEVVGEALRVALAGAACGLLLALLAGRLIAAQLDGVTAFDLPTYAATFVALAGAAVFASWVPSRRARSLESSTPPLKAVLAHMESVWSPGAARVFAQSSRVGALTEVFTRLTGLPHEDRPQRSVPVRKWEEVQEMLRRQGRRRGQAALAWSCGPTPRSLADHCRGHCHRPAL